MAIDLTGIRNVNEYYTNHYLSSIFEENATELLVLGAKAKEDGRRTYGLLRESRQYYVMHEKAFAAVQYRCSSDSRYGRYIILY